VVTGAGWAKLDHDLQFTGKIWIGSMARSSMAFTADLKIQLRAQKSDVKHSVRNVSEDPTANATVRLLPCRVNGVVPLMQDRRPSFMHIAWKKYAHLV
jgi:hypothetical protein